MMLLVQDHISHIWDVTSQKLCGRMYRINKPYNLIFIADRYIESDNIVRY